MPVSDDQIAALRALLADDFDGHEQMLSQLDPEEAKTGYAALVGAAFCEAVERRFSKGDGTAEVIEFVASVRRRSDNLRRRIDPVAAERMILAVFTDEDVQDVDHNVAFRLEVALLGALVAQENLKDAELDSFLRKARATADAWTSE